MMKFYVAQHWASTEDPVVRQILLIDFFQYDIPLIHSLNIFTDILLLGIIGSGTNSK